MTAVHGEPRPANLEQGWTVDDSTFGARLALVRQRMQWNIKEAARECGIPAASWGTWENGAMPRRYTEMCRLISDRTGCDLGWLVMGPPSRGGAASGNNSKYPALPDQLIGTGVRPPDNRPNGRPHTAPARTAYVERPGRRRRGR